MIYLMDVSALLPLMWPTHEHYDLVQAWVKKHGDGLEVASCPISELGFLRTSMQVMKSDDSSAVKLLETFRRHPRHHFWPDDVSPSSLSGVQGHKQLTDLFLAELAHRHNARLAAVDKKISHHAVTMIS